jgi:hypothetical protein
MGLSPIAGIRAVSLLKPSHAESFVPPALASDPAGQAGDDRYSSSGEDSGRDPDPENADPEPERAGESGADLEEALAPAVTETKVNFFA